MIAAENSKGTEAGVQLPGPVGLSAGKKYTFQIANKVFS